MSLKRSTRNQELYESLSENSENIKTYQENKIVDNSPKNFNNEYLDQAIVEAKHYNMEKGRRFDTDTSLNILHHLYQNDVVTKTKTTNEVEKNVEEKPKIILDDAIYKQLILENTNNFKKEEIKEEIIDPKPITKTEIVEKEIEFPQEEKLSTQEISKLISDINTNSEVKNEEVKDQTLTTTTTGPLLVDEILFQTQELKKQLTSYQQKVDVVDENVSKISKVIDVFLVIIFIALIAILGVFVYYLLKLKGISLF